MPTLSNSLEHFLTIITTNGKSVFILHPLKAIIQGTKDHMIFGHVQVTYMHLRLTIFCYFPTSENVILIVLISILSY